MSDPDCNRVSYFADPPVMHNYTARCTQPEGHDGLCWMDHPAGMYHKHRAPVATVEDPLGLRPQGGRHRRYVGAASGPNTVDGELRRRLAAARAASAVVEA